MRFLRFLRFSHLHKSLGQNSSFNPPSISTQINFPGGQSKIRYVSDFPRYYTTPSQDSKPVQSEKVSAIVDELMGLTLLEVMDLVEVMREKRGVNELPLMMVMMPGMGVAGGLKGAVKGGGPKGGGEEKKAEKTTFDVKLEAFDAAAKIKVIKEVRTFTSLGLKEAKDLVEKVPTLLKKGVTKEEADTIIAKLKEAGAKVTME